MYGVIFGISSSELAMIQPACESIFSSSMRALLRVFFGTVGLFIALFLGLFVFGFLEDPAEGLIPRSEYEILPGRNWERELLPESSRVILTLHIRGVIGEGSLTAGQIEEHLLTSREGVFEGDRVQGVIVYIDTPGGEATAADTIYRLLLDYKERFHVPIYTFVNGSCTSGGLYVASASDKIYATQGSIIGSVGVISWPPFYNISVPLEALGIRMQTVSKGIGKDDMNPFRPWAPDEAKEVEHLVDAFYQEFVDVVSKSRPKVTREMLINTIGAGVMTAKEAVEIGLIDGQGQSFIEVLKAICKQAGIADSTPVQVVTMRSDDWLTDLLGGASPLLTGNMSHSLEMSAPTSRFPINLK